MGSGADPLVLIVLGTRPEAIKLAPVVFALRARSGLSVKICSTGQHRELLVGALGDFGLRADFDLALMKPAQRLNDFAASGLGRLGALIRRLKPALVVVQGDTTTALIGALAAFHERAPVAHVEAGLRTFDRSNPYPEEANRVLVDQISDLHFAPTRGAVSNLRAEGIAGRGIVMSGNTGLDALRWALARPRAARAQFAKALSCITGGEGFALVTLHRRENFGEPLASLCAGLRRLLDARRDLHLVWPVHLNPEARRAARALGSHPRAHLLRPLSYPDMVAALSGCRFVLTDSGGLQEEAPFLGKPVLVLRRVTERLETVAAGVARVTGVDGESVFREALRLLQSPGACKKMARPFPLYGIGRASLRVAAEIAHFLR